MTISSVRTYAVFSLETSTVEGEGSIADLVGNDSFLNEMPINTQIVLLYYELNSLISTNDSNNINQKKIDAIATFLLSLSATDPSINPDLRQFVGKSSYVVVAAELASYYSPTAAQTWNDHWINGSKGILPFPSIKNTMQNQTASIINEIKSEKTVNDDELFGLNLFYIFSSKEDRESFFGNQKGASNPLYVADEAFVAHYLWSHKNSGFFVDNYVQMLSQCESSTYFDCFRQDLHCYLDSPDFNKAEWPADWIPPAQIDQDMKNAWARFIS